MEFKEFKLGNLVESVTDTTRIDKSKVILINTSDVENGKVLNHTYIENINLRGQFKKRFKKGDILYSEIRPKNKRFALVTFESDDYIASTKLMVLKRKSKKIENDYLFYILSSDKVINELQQIAELRSGTFPQITFSELANIKIKLPSLENQKKIVKILSNIDKKIELNNQMNDSLYKLSFNYLNKLLAAEKVPLKKFGKIQGGYAFKSQDLKNKKTKNRIIKIKNISNDISIDVTNSQFIDDSIIEDLDSKFLLKSGDVVIAMTGAELGKTGYIYGHDKYFLNQRVGVIRGNNKKTEIFLKTIFLSNEFQNELNSKGYGSAQPNISTFDIESILIRDISEDNLNKFYNIVEPLYNRIILNSEENLSLINLRNTLLPKLLNGEINLDKIEI